MRNFGQSGAGESGAVRRGEKSGAVREGGRGRAVFYGFLLYL